MSYASVIFIYFMAFGLLVFFTLPTRFKKIWLLLLSWCWYASWDIKWLVLFFIISNLNFYVLTFIKNRASNNRQILYQGLLAFDFLMFLLLKSGGMLYFNFTHPYGTSFIMFMIMGNVIDRWRGKDSEEMPSWVEFMLFSQFFLFLMGGPIEKSRHFYSEIRKDLSFRFNNLIDGILVAALGFAKIMILWTSLSLLIMNLRPSGEAIAFSLVLGFLGTLKVYLELSGFFEIARGMMRIFGMRPTINFRPFYFSTGPVDYWLRWNITVGSWIRSYLTFPLMLTLGKKIGQNSIIMISFVLMGLWHGVGQQFLLFGLFNGLIILVFNWVQVRKLPSYLGRLLGLTLIIGNGLIPYMFSPHLQTTQVFSYKELFLKNINSFSLVVFGLVFLVEVVQEKTKNVDWFLDFSIKCKTVWVLLLLLFFAYALDMDLIEQRALTSLPIYFKL